MAQPRSAGVSKVPIAQHQGAVRFSSFNQMETRQYFIRFKEGMTDIGPWVASFKMAMGTSMARHTQVEIRVAVGVVVAPYSNYQLTATSPYSTRFKPATTAARRLLG